MPDFIDTKQLKKESLLVWIDLEMTGLNPFTDSIIEIAVVITDSFLNILEKGPSIVVHQPEEMINKMDRNEKVIDMFFKTGYIDEVRNSKISIKKAESIVLAFLKNHLKEDEAPLCGKSVYVDRIFLFHHMPQIIDFLHHKDIDVSTVKELYRRWHKDPVPFVKNAPHRAMDDILDSIKELKYYKDKFLNAG